MKSTILTKTLAVLIAGAAMLVPMTASAAPQHGQSGHGQVERNYRGGDSRYPVSNSRDWNRDRDRDGDRDGYRDRDRNERRGHDRFEFNFGGFGFGFGRGCK